MSILQLVWNYLKSKPFNTVLNILLLALGVAVITVILLFNRQFQSTISKNGKGIDLVVGAKGSPLQLILCNIFHADFPTGNINLMEAEKIAKNRLVKQAIPLALGDSYYTYRIVGTNKEYADLYKMQLSDGDWWKENLEVTIGSTVARNGKLKIGDRFASVHGLAEGGHSHDEKKYVVKGIMKAADNVLDNLILTAIESVWIMHEEEDTDQVHHHEVNAVHDTSFFSSRLVPSISAKDSTHQITSLLIEYRSPMGAVQMPRYVNSQSNLQAASPAFEIARLLSILGVGVTVLRGFAYILIFISGLSIFIALYNSLKERRYDLAIMRSMGASRFKIMFIILLEGALLTFIGSVMGIILGHSVFITLSSFLEETQRAGIDGFAFYTEEWILLVGSVLLGAFCATIPAIQAYRTDISKVLAGN
jgi:putative ABC transport system permease protein